MKTFKPGMTYETRSILQLRRELSAVRSLIQYALEGPDDPRCWRKILLDILERPQP